MKLDHIQSFTLDAKQTHWLRAMAVRALEHVHEHTRASIERIELAFGGGEVVAVFKLTFAPPIAGMGDPRWVVVGDLPSAYLIADDLPNASAALERYCERMTEWIDAVRGKRDFAGVSPVEHARDEEHAALLERRVAMLRRDYVLWAAHPHWYEPWQPRVVLVYETDVDTTRLAEYDARGPVWMVDSPANLAAERALRDSVSNPVTTFRAEPIARELLQEIEDHHGLGTNRGEYVELEVRGADLDERTLAKLRAFDFERFEPLPEGGGFIAYLPPLS